MSVVASVVLGVALLVAGGAKIAAGPAWPAQASALGAPAIAVPAVPWVEILIGALCCVQLARPWPALAALVLLLLFSVLLALRLAQGLHPPCACFGSWSAKPLSWRHLARNGALVALAVTAIVTA